MTVAKADRRERKQVSKPHEVDTPVESSGVSVVNVCENVIDRQLHLDRRIHIC